MRHPVRQIDRSRFAASGATDALVAVDRHDRPAKPSSGLLEWL